MTAFFVALFFIGLIAAVRVMLYGVERQRPSGEGAERTFSAWPAVAAAFLVSVGVAGYVLVRLAVAPLVVWAVSVGTAAIIALTTRRLVGQWWTVVPEHDVDDERYVLQGSLARVVSGIAPGGTGSVSLASDEARGAIPARSLGAEAVAAGAEVVIERIEDGVAFVEEWAEVEKRL